MAPDAKDKKAPQANALSAKNKSLDLLDGMFRSGKAVEKTTISMQRQLSGVENTTARFTEIDGLALFEGDIVLGSVQEARAATAAKGVGIAGEEYRWEDGLVPYVVQEELEPLVKAAIEHWEKRTPFQFRLRTNESDYISFEKKNGCWSRVGRQRGMQVISLGEGCGSGAAIHEIGHSLGLWHEQSRSDRDEYITIVAENVVSEYLHNFDKHIQDGRDLGNYDYDSIMHYPATAFSRNGRPTIITKKDRQPIGQRNGLSKGDILAIKIMYPTLKWQGYV